MYMKAAKYGSLLSVFGLSLHIISHGYIAVETAAARQFTATKTAVVEGLAADFGFERKQELEQLTLEDMAEKEALVNGVNPALVRAQMHVESKNNQYAESPVGAIGPMQVMPFNAKRCGLPHYSKLWNAELNIKCGVQILAEEMRTYKNDVVKALQVYNGGPKCIGRCGESVNYSRNVLARMATDIR